jgi:hypothetical protein
MARFTAIPAVPEGVGSEWQTSLLEAMKENIELLTQQRGERDRSSSAITRDRVRVLPVESRVAGLTTRSEGTSIGFGAPAALTSNNTVDIANLHNAVVGITSTLNGVAFPNFDDYERLVADVVAISQDLSDLRTTVNALIASLRS